MNIFLFSITVVNKVNEIYSITSGFLKIFRDLLLIYIIYYLFITIYFVS